MARIFACVLIAVATIGACASADPVDEAVRTIWEEQNARFGVTEFCSAVVTDADAIGALLEAQDVDPSDSDRARAQLEERCDAGS